MEVLDRICAHYNYSPILMRRIIKSTAHLTLCFIFNLIPKINDKLGMEAAFLPLIAVIVHPGRRFSATLKHAINCIFGLATGLVWALIAREIARCCISNKNASDAWLYEHEYRGFQAALGIMYVFEFFMLMYHGWMRSVNHTYFSIVFPTFLVVHFAFSEDLNVDSRLLSKSYLVPFLLGIAMAFFWNVALFPEFGSKQLGESIVDLIQKIRNQLDSTTAFWRNLENIDQEEMRKELKKILQSKDKLKSSGDTSNTVFKESLYELSYSHLPPQSIDIVLDELNKMLPNIYGFVNSCHVLYLGLSNDKEMDFLTVEREIEYINKEKVLSIMRSLNKSVTEMHSEIVASLRFVENGIIDCYDVKKLFEEDKEELKKGLVHQKEKLNAALSSLAFNFEKETNGVVRAQRDIISLDDEMFILSSFLTNFKNATSITLNLLDKTDILLNLRHTKKFKTIHLNFFSGSYKNHNKSESQKFNYAPSLPSIPDFRNIFQESNLPHLIFGIQVTITITISTFVQFMPESRNWSQNMHNPWVAFVAVLSLEPSSGATFFVTFLRIFGVIFGSIFAYITYLIYGSEKHGNIGRTVGAVIFSTFFFAIPGFHFFLGTPRYLKSAIIYIITIYVVFDASMKNDDIKQNFAKRCFACVGGVVALIVQNVIFPLRCRLGLFKELGFSINAISQLLAICFPGVESSTERIEISEENHLKFAKIVSEIDHSLEKIQEFKTFVKHEPKLKGEYQPIDPLFNDCIRILKALLERCELIESLKYTAGNEMLSTLQKEPKIFKHRQTTIISLMNNLQIASLSLRNKTPLPPNMLSSRIAHRKMTNSIKEIFDDSTIPKPQSHSMVRRTSSQIYQQYTVTFLKDKLLAWNSVNSQLSEIIEFSEELIKINLQLCGCNLFRYGFLSRPNNDMSVAMINDDFNVDEEDNCYSDEVHDFDDNSDDIENSDYEGGAPLSRLATLNKYVTLDA
ncbi:hypothetical protein HANVADRAFT_53746 [Hanseniaspora valbyensis NRRL Y-1626]|uniref:Uncharacterized protein n=1 Tax=Hanseniaspora valbyensis NRRL Y-1626 TaxID=766949 RepID=A0A1B7TAC1_9ASCO|nr:hypothetical protein HANVADRAFT_53746 [Hanseniaspora valbyensis NRRL Y-1626]